MRTARVLLLGLTLTAALPLCAQAAHTHLFDEPSYRWSDRAPYTCTVTLTCLNAGCTAYPQTRDCTVTVKRIAPTCTSDGAEIYTASFQLDGGTLTNPMVKSVPIPKTGHTFTRDSTTKATPEQDGMIVEQCNCGSENIQTIPSPKTVKLSRTAYSYNGRAKKPTVTVTDRTGARIPASNYTVSYPKYGYKVGTHAVSVKFRGSSYSGALSTFFTVAPRSTEWRGLSARSRGFTARWLRRQTQVSGYQISYSTNKSFSAAKAKKYTKTATTSATVTGLSRKRTYYVRIRTYKTVTETGKSKTYYSSWTPVRKIKTK